MAKGRKRKAGKRTPSGRLSRAGVSLFDRGTERVQAMQALYGPDGADAIGRAYRAGLLGEGVEAKALLDTARKVSNLYWRAYSTGSYKCPLADRTYGGGEPDHERAKASEQWLEDNLAAVSRMGVRSSFDALVIDVHPDHGPAFLDRLIWAKKTGEEAGPNDAAILRAALDGLSAVC